MSRRLAGLAIACALACTALVAPAAGAATLSDGFASRDSFKGFGKVTGSNVGATREAGEPALKPLAPGGHTVWVEWEAPSSGYVTLSTCESGIGTVLGAYTGNDVAALTEVDSVAYHGLSGCSGIRDGITFFAPAGAKFPIVLDGNSFFLPPSLPPPTEGPLSLQIEATPPPANDDFAAATAITGRTTVEPGGARFYFASEFGYNWSAGKEAGEPEHAGDPGGASVWYSWTAPESRPARVSICCSATQLIAVYTGGAPGSLSEVRSGRGLVEFQAVAGITYAIAVDGELSAPLAGPLQGSFNLVLQMTPPALLEERAVPPIAGGGPLPRAVKQVAPRTHVSNVRVRQKARTATFTFSSTASGATFRCRLGGRPWAACTSPRTYGNLDPGPHAFRVYAVDAAGVRDPTPVVSHFSIRPPRRHR